MMCVMKLSWTALHVQLLDFLWASAQPFTEDQKPNRPKENMLTAAAALQRTPVLSNTVLLYEGTSPLLLHGQCWNFITLLFVLYVFPYFYIQIKVFVSCVQKKSFLVKKKKHLWCCWPYADCCRFIWITESHFLAINLCHYLSYLLHFNWFAQHSLVFLEKEINVETQRSYSCQINVWSQTSLWQAVE